MLDGLQIDLWRPLAGLMIFLLAMRLIEEAIKSLAGRRIKQSIARNTDHPVWGVLTGTVATAILQSSSLVGLLVLAFVGARLMPLKQALLMIFGANLGTTATGWLVAILGFKLDLDAASFPLIVLGGLSYMVIKRGFGHEAGKLVMGLGLLLMALGFMKSALGEADPTVATDLLANWQLWQFALFGIAASMVMQSSSAVMVLTLSAINSGVIGLDSAAALVIGADLGTTSTVMFGAIGGSANKKRVALGHVVFNVVTDIIAFALLKPMVVFVAMLRDPLLALVAFHSLFNVLGVLMWTPLATRFARALERLFTTPTAVVNLYLDPAAATVPESALRALTNESEHLANRVIKHNQALFVQDVNDIPTKEEFRTGYRASKALEAEILDFALGLQLPGDEFAVSHAVNELLQAGRNILLSAKLCKDNLNDLRDLADYQPELFEKIIAVQRELYERLNAIAGSSLTTAQLEALMQENDDRHEWLHDNIYLLIKADEIPDKKVSTVLNLNRVLFNSNLALLNGVALLAEELRQPSTNIA